MPPAANFFIPYRRRCRHFAYAADAPLLSLPRRFPRFSGGIYPEGGSKSPSLRAERSKLPGGWRSTEYVFRTLSVGYFAFAQYDVKSPIVGVAATSPTRRTRPFCRYRDISPVSAGESTPKEEANYCLCEQREAISREGELP